MGFFFIIKLVFESRTLTHNGRIGSVGARPRLGKVGTTGIEAERFVRGGPTRPLFVSWHRKHLLCTAFGKQEY